MIMARLLRMDYMKLKIMNPTLKKVIAKRSYKKLFF